MATKFKYQWGSPETGIPSSFPHCLCLSAIILWIYVVKNMFGANKSAFLGMSSLVILLKSRSWVKPIDTLKSLWRLMVCIQGSPGSPLLTIVFIQYLHSIYSVCIKQRVPLFWQYFIVTLAYLLLFPLLSPSLFQPLPCNTIPQTTTSRG